MSATAAQIWLAYNAAENANDYAGMKRYVAADLSATVNGRPAVSSSEDDERATRELHRVYPDYHREVAEVIDAGDRAVVRWRMLGTPVSQDLPPLEAHGCSVVTAGDGVMTMVHVYCESAELDAVLEAAVNGA